jgi:hypothetical protein
MSLTAMGLDRSHPLEEGVGAARLAAARRRGMLTGRPPATHAPGARVHLKEGME